MALTATSAMSASKENLQNDRVMGKKAPLPLQYFRDSAAVFSSIIAAVLASVYCLCRAGFSHAAIQPILLALGVSWFFLHFAFAIKLLFPRLSKVNVWMLDDAVVTLAAPLLATAFGWVGGRQAGILLALCGGALFAIRFVRWLTQADLWTKITIVIAAVFLASYFAGATAGGHFQDPLAAAGLYNGLTNMDELYHASIVNMIVTYGVPSSGLDGLPLLRYHFGSHLLFAGYCNLLDSSAIDFYGACYAVLWLPLLVASVLLAGALLAIPGSPDDRGSVSWLFIWLTLMTIFVGVLPTKAREAVNFKDTAITSESMCVGLTYFLPCASVALSLLRRFLRNPQEIHTSEALAAALGLPVAVVVLGLLKNSVMALFLAGVTYAYLRTGLLRQKRLGAVSLLVSYGLFFIVSRLTATPESGDLMTQFAPFYHLRTRYDLAWLPYTLVLEHLWLIGAVSLRCLQEHYATVGQFHEGIARKKLLDIEVLLVVAVLGWIPGLIWPIGGNSPIFFVMVQRYLALAIIVGVLLSPSVLSRQPGWVQPGPGPWAWRRVPTAWVVAGCFLTCLALTMIVNTTAGVYRLVSKNLSRRGVDYVDSLDRAQRPTAPRDEIKAALRRKDLREAFRVISQTTHQTEMRTDPQAVMVRTLIQLGEMPVAERRTTALFIPRRNRIYWELLVHDLRKYRCFVAPALAGFAMVEGLPDPDPGLVFIGNTFELYRLPTEVQPRLSAAECRERVCRRAAGLGFARLAVVDVDDQGMPSVFFWETSSASAHASYGASLVPLRQAGQ